MRPALLPLLLASLFGCPPEFRERPGPDPEPEACDPEFPELPGEESDTGDTGAPDLPEVDPTGLVAFWPLDGDWDDALGDLDLTPFREGGFSAADVAAPGANQAYGPTGAESDNGAVSMGIPSLDLAAGFTLEGWYYKPGNDTKGVLFGLGEATWGTPRFYLQDAWGALQVVAGADGTTVSYDRQENGCWHHVAVVAPPDLDTAGGRVAVYVDGVELTPTGGDATLPAGLQILGGPVTAATFQLSYGGLMRLDELRLWGRPLSADEVTVAALPRGPGAVCPAVREPWEPGPRCTFGPQERPSTPAMPMEVRVLDEMTLLVLEDPSPWLYGELAAHCGTYLAAMEQNLGDLEDWWWRYQYHYALSDTLLWAWPWLMEVWSAPEAFRVAGCEAGEEAALPAETLRWLVPTREARIPRIAPGSGTRHDSHAERLLVGYLRLPWALQEGGTYAVQDRWGNEATFTFSSRETVSWAIKVNQVGGPADHPARRAVLGAWLGPAGALDLSRFAGEHFEVVDEATDETALNGLIGEPRESAETGEVLLDLDLSALSTPGTYHVVVPGMGRSWSFELGDDALGEAFYVHAQGLYHNRCAPLDAAVTPWARGDLHQVYQGAFPPDDKDDYGDHAAEGWGILDAEGAWVSLAHFDVVAATATTTPVAIVGGWHDAADFDRRPYHLGIVHELLAALELAPENFSDGQWAIPERANGVPDILDEARWGLGQWRSSQQADGGVGTWIEATSHPLIDDPGQDTQPYYLSYATRNSSLDYARHAAMMARVLEEIDPAAAAAWLDSAWRAWDYALDPAPHAPAAFEMDGEPLTFVDQSVPGEERLMLAAVELFLATGDAETWELLSDLDEPFDTWVGDLWWKQDFSEAVDVILFSDRLPAGWGQAALDALTDQADVWLAAQGANPYPWAWYDAEHRYHENWGWGQGRYRPLVDLALAWRFTGDTTYRTAVLAGLDVQLGLNPQGRVDTTGLGDHRTVTALHGPSDSDGIDEASPGITLYGALPSVPSQGSQRVWGYQESSRGDPAFDGADLSLLPPSFGAATAAEVDALLEDLLPRQRRECLLESLRPEEMEFTVTETVSPAILVTGLLLEPGWLPSDALRAREPLDAEGFRQRLWAMP
ncbi:MAG: glycoside hydrolase family 9 protein [Pseudomonadota bacterium]